MQTKQITRLTADENMYLMKDNKFYKTVDLKDSENVGSNIWIRDGDTKDNYREEEHIEPDE